MIFSEPLTLQTGNGEDKGIRVKLWRLAKRALMMIPSAPLSIKAYATIFLPITLPMNSSSKVMEGVCWFWMTVDTQIFKGCSHRKDSTAYWLAKFLAKHVTAPSNIVVGEHSKNPNRQHPSNTTLPALLHLPATSKGDWPSHWSARRHQLGSM